jgi:hypothetical protein
MRSRATKESGAQDQIVLTTLAVLDQMDVDSIGFGLRGGKPGGDWIGLGEGVWVWGVCEETTGNLS